MGLILVTSIKTKLYINTSMGKTIEIISTDAKKEFDKIQHPFFSNLEREAYIFTVLKSGLAVKNVSSGARVYRYESRLPLLAREKWYNPDYAGSSSLNQTLLQMT